MAYQQPYNPYGSYNPAMMYMPAAPAYLPQTGQAAQPMQPTQPTTQEAFICRPVTSREEAMATPVDYVRPILMPDFGHGKIYLKKFNQQTGASDIFNFTLEEQGTTQPEPQYATREELNALRDELEKLKKPAGKGKKIDDE